MTVYLLTVEHRLSADHWACATKAVAFAQLDNYVQEWWQDEMDGVAMPDGPRERVQLYFEHLDALDRPEYWSIESLELQPEIPAVPSS